MKPFEFQTPLQPAKTALHEVAARAPLTSQALRNLRGATILFVIAFHSSLAYLASTPPARPMTETPYRWLAFPISDGPGFLGFDIFCAWQDVYLMGLMFFLSALFTAPSLRRKGTWRFLKDRAARVVLPFIVGVVAIVPIALYPVYLQSAPEPTLSGYLGVYFALPFVPNGPLWFLWALAALTLGAVALCRMAPKWVDKVGEFAGPGEHAKTRLAIWAAVGVLLYEPLALAYTPFNWTNSGLFSFQSCRPGLYVLFYLAGLGVGAAGIENSLFTPEGPLARRWRIAAISAALTLFLWMGLTGLSMHFPSSLAAAIVADATYPLASLANTLALLAVALRFASRPLPWLGSAADNAFGIYLIHYIPMVWLQYALVGVNLPALAKFPLAFAGVLAISWTGTAAFRAATSPRRPATTARVLSAGAPGD